MSLNLPLNKNYIMKVLFTLLNAPEDLSNGGMYADLIMEFKNNGHEVTVIGGSQKKTLFYSEKGIRVLRVKSMPILYVKNLIKKGIGMATLPWYMKRAYKKYLVKEKFDWIVMPTPPITLIDLVKYIKQKSGGKLYTILRDIHPQSSASLGEIKYKWMIDYLYRRSDLGYNISDIIGCMSPENINFIKKEHNIPSSTRCTILYNWMSYVPFNSDNNLDLRNKYGLTNKYVVIFGGNIGLGQCIENIVDLACHYRNDENICFVVIGKGVKKDELQRMAKNQRLDNILFIDFMPRNEYLKFVKSVDIGLISIHGNNAAPTCPSKVLSYMSLKIPVLALINNNSDYGQVYLDNPNAGLWSVASDKLKVYKQFDKLYSDSNLRKQMGENGYEFYRNYLTTEKVFHEMIRQMTE